jgi:hypothetical protein
MHRACLDVEDKTVPQPEALYVDSRSGHQLVIERKSISWPVDYPYRHKNDHAVGELFTDGLRDLTVDDLYEIRLPMLMEGKRADLLSYARDAVGQIRADWRKVASGQIMKGRAGANWWWAFGRSPEWGREDNAPSKGIKVAYVGPGMSFDDFFDPEQPPEALVSSINKIFAGCTAKFAAYSETRRILLLDPHGDLQTESIEWWQKMWAHKPPPPAIEEIWSGVYDWITDETQDWVFQQLYGDSGA